VETNRASTTAGTRLTAGLPPVTEGTTDAARIPAIALTQVTAGKSETQERLCPIVDTGEKDGGSHLLPFVCVPALADF
jgi:hypothetical protein